MIMNYAEINETLKQFARLDLPRGVTARLCGEIDGFTVTNPKVNIKGKDGAGVLKEITLDLVKVPTSEDIVKLSTTLYETYF